MSLTDKGHRITMNDIIREGDPILRRKVQEVKFPLSDEDRNSIDAMMRYLKESQDEELSEKYGLRPGVGISANQVGLDRRMFAVFFTDVMEEENPTLYEYKLINPKIVSHSTAMTYLPDGEGCLSVDREVEGIVPRYEKIKLKAYDTEGKEVLLKLKGYPAIVMQHELDHLNGVMFYDHINAKDPQQEPAGVNIQSLW
ncbi:peptide deformylase [Saccharibacillus sp. CPCC 101409]|uniref:peptide deformylase n=1 Tax=Saccharibacillus sp. CPCC 101409 TaxID=3058041 RepID=UPI002671D10C|nr:peptide deformylase [Saccharibacillus sp. CPCC 101409]MDO3409061.1 peptide deformylase [Saccharibacillus sp. CPCC 101409]